MPLNKIQGKEWRRCIGPQLRWTYEKKLREEKKKKGKKKVYCPQIWLSRKIGKKKTIVNINPEEVIVRIFYNSNTHKKSYDHK